MRHFGKQQWIVLGIWMCGWGGVSCLSEASVEYFPGGNAGDKINTNFALAVPDETKSGRMTAESTQQDQVFRGMKNMVLLPFNTGKNGNLVVGSTGLQGESTFSLEGIGSQFTGGSHNNPTNAQMKAKMFANILVPQGTNAVLLYGESELGGDGFANGKIIPKMEAVKKAMDVSFEQAPVTPLTAATAKDHSPEAKAMLDLLNGVGNATGWKEQATPEHKGDKLYELYWDFKGNNAASAQSVLAVLQDLYSTMDALANAEGVEQTVKLCANNVLTAITAKYGKATVKARKAVPEDHTKDSWVLEYADPSYNFPRNLNLPDGAVQVQLDTQDQFVFATETTNGTGMVTADYDTYTYPPSLYYRANSSLATSNKLQDQFVNSSSNWADFLKMNYSNGGTPSSVEPGVSSVAVIDPLNYAVGVLQTAVRLTDQPMFDAKKNSISAPDFVLTGILIGGQQPVNWDFTPNPNLKVFYTVYDKHLGVGAQQQLQSISYTAPNYTLVFPSPIIGETGYNVNICLEFENRGKDFYGFQEKLIPSGTKFYLVGQLNLGDIVVPEGVDRAFMSDHITVANFTLGPHCLKDAYNVVPDLRTSKLEIGMTVNLVWKEGLDFGSKEI